MTVSTQPPNLPDYEQLVKFLFKPFLSATEAIGVDCEYTIERRRIWIRVAVATADQGSAFGRGGRNIQAIRTVVQAAAATVGQSIHLDVYGNNSSSRHADSDDGQDNGGGSSGSRPARSAPNRRSSGGEDAPAEDLRQRSNVPPPKPRRQA